MTTSVHGPRGMCPPDHAHAAKTTCYIAHRCGCAECRDGLRKREAARRKATAYGSYEPRVRVEPVRERVQHLIAAGVQKQTIERGTGVPLTTLLYAPRRQKWIAADKARRVLEYLPHPEDYAPTSAIDARGTRRRVQALVALGWSLAAIGRRAGIAGAHMSHLARADRTTAGTAEKIAAVYGPMSMALPPVTTRIQKRDRVNAKAMAAREGWVPPLAWDDIDFDECPPAVDETRTAA